MSTVASHLQHTATHCNAHCDTLQSTATHCNALQCTAPHTATHCNALQHTAPHTAAHCNAHCNALQHTVIQPTPAMSPIPSGWFAASCITLQRTLQHAEMHCITLQHTQHHTTTHCNTQKSNTDFNVHTQISFSCTQMTKSCHTHE